MDKAMSYAALAKKGRLIELGEEPVGAVTRALKARLVIVAPVLNPALPPSLLICHLLPSAFLPENQSRISLGGNPSASGKGFVMVLCRRRSNTTLPNPGVSL